MPAACKCVLRSLDRASHCDVTIWNSDPVTLGRSRDTRIKDKRCSKRQVEVQCQFPSSVCRLRQLGPNSSSLNGAPLSTGSHTTAGHGDLLQVLTGSYQYRIEFDPPPTEPGSPAPHTADTCPPTTASTNGGSASKIPVSETPSINDSGDIKEATVSSDHGSSSNTTTSSSTSSINNSSVPGSSSRGATDSSSNSSRLDGGKGRAAVTAAPTKHNCLASQHAKSLSSIGSTNTSTFKHSGSSSSSNIKTSNISSNIKTSSSSSNIKHSSSNIKTSNSSSSNIKHTSSSNIKPTSSSSNIKPTSSSSIIKPTSSSSNIKVGSSNIKTSSSSSNIKTGGSSIFSMPRRRCASPPAAASLSKKRPAADDEPASDASQALKKPKTGGGVWQSVQGGNLLIYNKDSLPGSAKVASYDMDGTLILTQSGKVFPTDYNDWKIIFSEVPGKLKQLNKDGYKIVIFTNQAGISTGKATVAGIQGKISRIMERLGVDIQVFVSTGPSKFRKPSPNMWQYLEDHCNAGVAVDRSSSLYVGDAAGRPAQGKARKKDHSSADRLFALNLGVPFYTPEEHFLGRKTETFVMPEFDPRQPPVATSLFEPSDVKVPANKAELVVLCGFPGSGKSHLATTELAGRGYQIASRDTLGTWQKCAAVVKQALQAGQSVVVDNTNPDRESRGRYIKIAADLKKPARCFLLAVSKEQAKHNNKFREFTDPSHAKVSDMIFNMYNSKFQAPELSEGFTDIVKVNCLPSFTDPEHEKLYRCFLLEK